MVNNNNNIIIIIIIIYYYCYNNNIIVIIIVIIVYHQVCSNIKTKHTFILINRQVYDKIEIQSMPFSWILNRGWLHILYNNVDLVSTVTKILMNNSTYNVLICTMYIMYYVQ